MQCNALLRCTSDLRWRRSSYIEPRGPTHNKKQCQTRLLAVQSALYLTSPMLRLACFTSSVIRPTKPKKTKFFWLVQTNNAPTTVIQDFSNTKLISEYTTLPAPAAFLNVLQSGGLVNPAQYSSTLPPSTLPATSQRVNTEHKCFESQLHCNPEKQERKAHLAFSNFPHTNFLYTMPHSPSVLGYPPPPASPNTARQPSTIQSALKYMPVKSLHKAGKKREK